MIVVVSFGKPKIEEVLRTAAVMAADRASLLGTRQVIGPLATAGRMVAVKSRISSVVGNRRSTTTPIRLGKGFRPCSGGARAPSASKLNSPRRADRTDLADDRFDLLPEFDETLGHTCRSWRVNKGRHRTIGWSDNSALRRLRQHLHARPNTFSLALRP